MVVLLSRAFFTNNNIGDDEMITWIEDDNGNKCSVEYFGSKKEAQKALDSLVDCKKCVNCVNCSECSYCVNCSDCSYCSRCSRCLDCLDCSDCSRCSRCFDSSRCFDCSYCSYCSDCSDCWHCSDKKADNVGDKQTSCAGKVIEIDGKKYKLEEIK